MKNLESNTMKYETTDIDVPKAMADLNRILVESFSCELHQRYFLLAHTLAPLLSPFTKTKAIVHCEGNMCAGKTTAARLVGFLMNGYDPINRVSIAGLYAQSKKSSLVVFDEIENRHLQGDLLNFLLMASTGAGYTKRVKGQKDVEEKLNTTVWLSSIEPIEVPELLARTFVIKFDKKYLRKDAEFMDDLIAEALEKRGEILAAISQVLEREVIPTIKHRQEAWLDYIRQTFPKHSKYKMDEYTATLMCLICPLLDYLPLPKREADLISGGVSHADYILDKWLTYQDAIAR